MNGKIVLKNEKFYVKTIYIDRINVEFDERMDGPTFDYWDGGRASDMTQGLV